MWTGALDGGREEQIFFFFFLEDGMGWIDSRGWDFLADFHTEFSCGCSSCAFHLFILLLYGAVTLEVD